MLLTGLLVSIIITGYTAQSRASGDSSAQAIQTVNRQLTIWVKDQNGHPLSAKVEIGLAEKKILEMVSNNTGLSQTNLPVNQTYNLIVSLDGYTPVQQDFRLDKSKIVNVVLVIVPAPVIVPVAPAPVVVSPPAPQQAPAPKPVVHKSATSTITPAPQAASPSSELSVSGILSQINFQRQSNGLSMVSLNDTLSSAAAAKAKDMVDNNYFAHTSPAGVDDFYFINQSGYNWQAAGINLAEGDFSDGADLVNAWMNSPGHRANILADFGKQIGIAINGKYFVMMIANPR
jgi:uncharacterized protein YkwD